MMSQDELNAAFHQYMDELPDQLTGEGNDAPDGITLRVVVADPSRGNAAAEKANYPVLSEQFPLKKPR